MTVTWFRGFGLGHRGLEAVSTRWSKTCRAAATTATTARTR